MMTIKVELLANRYHANPWNRAHVEGIVEWPPSPWRLLRAILAGGFAAGIPQPEMLLIAKVIAAELPSFYLPQGSYLQTRSPRKDRDDTTDLFSNGKDVVDAYLNFDTSDRTIWVQWPIELPVQQQLTLSRCLAYCRYIGRREADAVWSLADTDDMPAPNAWPTQAGVTQVAACDGEVEALLKSPYQSQVKEKRAVFPGLRWVNYQIDSEPPTGLVAPTPTYYRAEIALRTPGRPQAESTLRWSEKLHRALSSIGTPNFTGCDHTGAPLKTHHHTFIQPVLTEGELTGFELHCPAGFTDAEIAHLYKTRKLYAGKREEMHLRVIGLHVDSGEPTQSWESTTPFYLTRWPLTRNGQPRLIPGTEYQKDGPEHQALKALCYLPQFDLDPRKCCFESDSQGLVMTHNGKLVGTAIATRWTGIDRWMCDRTRGKKVSDNGYMLRLVFPQPVHGPIAIGYSAHFGLGLLRGLVDVEPDYMQLASEEVI